MIESFVADFIVFAGASVVQMARCTATGRDCAMKFYLDEKAFEKEKHEQLNMLNLRSTTGSSLAYDLCLPEIYKIVDDPGSGWGGGRDTELPPCIVFERGESLQWIHCQPLDQLAADMVRDLWLFDEAIVLNSNLNLFYCLNLLYRHATSRFWSV